ncbi:unnamed protein product [Schistosoma margrebowiei]|uniref:Uncharacterized protein n=1 Tax=Schistosoma margrebowiei TaxID=48269 RepID=A0A183LZT3_9TREM|nr:unnamed protein product [Schistosoma margrebowiei]
MRDQVPSASLFYVRLSEDSEAPSSGLAGFGVALSARTEAALFGLILSNSRLCVGLESSIKALASSSLSSVLLNNNNHNNDLILATGSACPSNPGNACSHDYLSVDARISNVYDGTISNIPIIRFCLINNSTLKTIATKTKTKLTEIKMINSSLSYSSPSSSISSGSSSFNSIDYNKLYPPDESYLVGQIYGPISNVYGLQFTSNLNLLDPYIIHGKGIVLEYIGKH